MRTDLFRHLLDLPVEFHDRWSGGQLLSRVMSDLSTIRRWTVFGLVMLLVSATTVVVGVGLMIWTSRVLGLVYLVGAVPMIWLGFRFREDYKVVARRARDQAGDLATTVEESVHGIRVLKAFGRGEDALDDFARQADELRTTEVHKARTLSRVSFALGAIPEAILAVSLGHRRRRWPSRRRAERRRAGRVLRHRGGGEQPGRAARHAARDDARRASAATDRYLQVMDTGSTVQDPADPAALPPADPAGLAWSSCRASRSRTRAAPSTARSSRASTCVLEPGETMALVGLTGSGKTTLLQLVPRLYDVTAGSVRIDGVDVRDLTRADLRGAVSVAFEDPILFSASVRENVLLGTDLTGSGGRRPRRRGPRGRPRRLRVRAARRARHGHRRGGAQPVGRPAPAHRAGPRHRRPAAGAAARRPALGARRHHRGRGDRAAARRCSPARRRSSSPTGRRPSRSPTGSRCSRTAGSRGSAGTPTCSPTHPHYRYVLTALSRARRAGRPRPRGGAPMSDSRGVATTHRREPSRGGCGAARSRCSASLLQPGRRAGVVDRRARRRLAARRRRRARARRVRHRPGAARADAHGDAAAARAGRRAAYLAAALLGGVLTAATVRASARVSQTMLLDLRRRVFRHTQRLSLEFHEQYTSGPDHLAADLGRRRRCASCSTAA